MIAVTAVELGASIGQASLAVAALGIGQLLGDLPAGLVASRLGERRAMMFASLFTIIGLVMCVLASGYWVFAAGIFLIGLCTSVWFLARQTYLATAIPIEMRGRAISAMGGVQRFGRFAGPFVGAVGISLWGTDVPYLMHIVLAAGAAALLLSMPDHPDRREVSALGPPKLRQVAIEHRRTFATLGTAVALTGLVRASRTAIIPLWGHQLGLDASTISIVFGVSNLVEPIFVYPAGVLIDRYGRRVVAVPSMLIMAVALFVLLVPGDVGIFIVSSVLMGVGNGLSAGIVSILGADASPRLGRAEFLSVWRLFIDSGTAGGALLVAGVAGVSTLGWSVAAAGCLALVSAGTMRRYVPRGRRPPG